MIKKLGKCLWGIVSTALLALYLFLFYELVLVPAILDWSVLGVGLAFALVGLLIWSLPAGKRLSTAILGIIFLLAMKAMDSIREYPMLKQGVGLLFIFFVLLIVGKLLGHFTFRSYLVIFLAAIILNASFDPAQVPFWTGFKVKWESPLLYKKLASVDYFPVKLADVDGDNIKEIITQENLPEARKELVMAAKNKKYQILEPENNHFAVYKWDGASFKELPPTRYSIDKLAASLPVDYLGYPFYESSLQVNSTEGIEQKMTPLLDKAHLVERAVNFGSFPFEMLSLAQQSLETGIRNQAALGQSQLQSSAAAIGDIIPGPPLEKAAIDDSLKIREMDSGREVVGAVYSEQVPYIGTSEVLVGDVDNDRADEILLTAETSRILKLTRDLKWQTLWASPEIINDKTRFQHFRFEDFAPLGSDTTPQIIALAKSNVRENPTRYMTGYEYKNGTLQQKWRVFAGLINLRAGDVDGDGQNELVGYMYRQQRVFVLEKHNLPVAQLLYAITGGLILFGFGWQLKLKKFTLPFSLITLVAISVLLSGCAIKSGPREFAKPEVTRVEPAAEAAEKLGLAFDTTARDGKKFWFTGWAATKVQKRNIGFYIPSGTYDRDHGYTMDTRILGQPLRYYRWGNDVYVSEEDKWRKAAPTSAPLEPFIDFSSLKPFTGKAVGLPAADVLGAKCDVYEITLDAADAVKAAKSMGLKLAADNKASKPYIDRMTMRMTLWIGQNDNLIYQYKTQTIMPVPNAGSMYQEVFFKFWKYNNSSINLESPQKKIEPYLIKD
ncbi:MAG: hypothetical protein CVV03_09870 [Firmicutes bacterium HGW-Firmicutes-8]|nr:MAG: hypothetical protein CVV03_09870 [Firmicutes bacterium HGW-Firmicutes-8]